MGELIGDLDLFIHECSFLIELMKITFTINNYIYSNSQMLKEKNTYLCSKTFNVIYYYFASCTYG